MFQHSIKFHKDNVGFVDIVADVFMATFVGAQPNTNG